METRDFAEQWKSMQRMFLPTSEISTAFQENARRFWENQEKILDNMQAFANAWFERRRTGTHSAREAAESMSATETMSDLVQAYRNWAGGAFERIMADGLAYQQQIIAATGALASPSIAPSAGEKEVEATQSKSKAPARPKIE